MLAGTLSVCMYVCLSSPFARVLFARANACGFSQMSPISPIFADYFFANFAVF